MTPCNPHKPYYVLELNNSCWFLQKDSKRKCMVLGEKKKETNTVSSDAVHFFSPKKWVTKKFKRGCVWFLPMYFNDLFLLICFQKSVHSLWGTVICLFHTHLSGYFLFHRLFTVSHLYCIPSERKWSIEIQHVFTGWAYKME